VGAQVDSVGAFGCKTTKKPRFNRGIRRFERLFFVAAVAFAKALLKLFDAPFGIDKALLTGVKRMIARPDLNGDFGLGAQRFHDDFTVTVNFTGDSFGVNTFFHTTPFGARGGALFATSNASRKWTASQGKQT
jgi:hypothetical protein